MRGNKDNHAVYYSAIGLVTLAAIINAPPIAAVLFAFLSLTAFAAHFTGFSSSPKRAFFAPVGVVGAGITIQLAMNHVMTGLMEVTPFRLFWNLANQSSFSTVVSPYLLLFASEGTSPTVGNAGLGSSLNLIWMRDLLHIQFLNPYLVYACGGLIVLMIAACFFDLKARRPFLPIFVPAALLLTSAATLALFIRQPGSIERFYLFNLLAAVLLTVSAPVALHSYFYSWKARHPILRNIKRAGPVCLTVMMVTAAVWSGSTWLNGRYYHETTDAFLSKLDFATGRSSFKDTLLKPHIPRNPSQWPKREISEECLGVMAALRNPAPAHPADSSPRVWTLTFLQEAGCHVLPGIRFMMEFSNRFGRNWHRIVFGDPVTAQHELQLIGIRHVYVNLADLDEEHKTGFSTAIFGCLAYSPLLDPALLKSRFRIAWQRNDAYLLVLAGHGQGEIIPDSVARRFAEKRAAQQPGLGDMAGICARLAQYYRQSGEDWPVHADPALPPLKGWQ